MPEQVCEGTCLRSRIKEIVARCGGERTNLLAILHGVQDELGHLSQESMAEVASVLGVKEAEVYGVATFYHLFTTRPKGQRVVRLCVSPPCHLEGAEAVLEAVCQELRLRPGRTSKDGKWTLETVSCLGLCGVAPAMMVDDEVYGNLTPELAREALRKLGAGGREA